MNTINKDNLLLLAQHLRNGRLFQSSFSFETFRCGTAGCAIGECSGLFGDERLEGFLRGMNSDSLDVRCDSVKNITAWAKEKFGIDEEVFDYLFIPIYDIYKGANGWLTENATKEQVAALIEDFVHTGEIRVRGEDELELISHGRGDEVSNDID